MSQTLTSVIADPPSGRGRAVLFDHHDYAQRVILQGRDVPWDPPMPYSNFYGQAQALLGADAALLDLGRFYARSMKQHPELGQAMGARSRTGYALRTMLGHPGLAAEVVELATTFTKTQRVPVVVAIPSPVQWLGLTHQFSGAGDTSGLDADKAENASMYVADWLRSFAALPLAGVLLDDRPATEGQLPSVELGTYTPVANVTDNYRWTLAMRHTDHVEVRGDRATGAVLPGEFWQDDEAPAPEGDFLLGAIPPDAVPEEVLARVATLT